MDGFEAALVALLPRLRRFAHGLTRDPVDAEELVQQTAERALRSHGQRRADTGLDVWAYRLMRDLRTDMAHSRRHHGATREPGWRPPVAEGSADLRIWMRALDHLPDEQREAVALVMIEGLSYAEAADVLGVLVGTLASRLAGGRQALLGMLEAE